MVSHHHLIDTRDLRQKFWNIKNSMHQNNLLGTKNKNQSFMRDLKYINPKLYYNGDIRWIAWSEEKKKREKSLVGSRLTKIVILTN